MPLGDFGATKWYLKKWIGRERLLMSIAGGIQLIRTNHLARCEQRLHWNFRPAQTKPIPWQLKECCLLPKYPFFPTNYEKLLPTTI